MTTGDHGLLSPGLPRAKGQVDDATLVAAMVTVEVAWLRALSTTGALVPGDVSTFAERLTGWTPDLDAVALRAEAAGNPVVPVVEALRAHVAGHPLAGVVHRGLTSQDVLDTALVLLSRSAMSSIRADLTVGLDALGALAERHRETVMTGRTLTQYAVPITFGLKVAQWMSGLLDADGRLEEALAVLPVQCGGAAGTLSLVDDMAADPIAVAESFAAELGLRWPGLPWHTNRAPVTRVGDAVVAACDALGVIAADISLLSRPEFGEVREGFVAGRGGSSTMPHKRNPVLSVLVRSASLQAPMLAAQLHLAAGQAVDERPDGAWHSEWPALRRLLEVGVVAASQTAELVVSVEVDGPAIRARAEAVATELLSERGGHGAPRDYLGAAPRFIDEVLARHARRGGHDG